MHFRVRHVSSILLKVLLGLLALALALLMVVFTINASRSVDVPASISTAAGVGTYPIVGTGQTTYWNLIGNAIDQPTTGDSLYGQNASYQGNTPKYRDNNDGTITDLVTGLIWTKTLDLNEDGEINSLDQMTVGDALASPANVNVGGYTDWRIPTLKEAYSLINFEGVDVGVSSKLPTTPKPFIDTKFFDFGYGDTSVGDRFIDAHIVTTTFYTGKVYKFLQTMFGVNFADGRIKGYPPAIGMNGLSAPKFYIYYVRGAKNYGVNNFIDNKNGTITDKATSLMWSQADSLKGMDWTTALKWVQKKNKENYLGHSDWKLPDVKELQSIVDYTRSPSASNSAAIDPIFSSTSIVDEAGDKDWPWYWSSTTHASVDPRTSESRGNEAAYVCFGRAMGKQFGMWLDVHGAGAQRTDSKQVDTKQQAGNAPQGDALRITNFVRLVRNA
ncbi:unannotated protein [freshwater metagenome]|uniref:Unannotated protein n=1 Tax=freshwater metagenome TaxID=449393 RepID=A0A6J7MN38_9ZZZZ